MSKQTEALKLALEAITQYLAESPDPSEEAVEGLCDARAMLRKALAEQPAPVAEPREPQQESVAWRYKPKGEGGWGWSFVELKPLDAVNYKMEPLYTSPPAQRKPWVGLTDEEVMSIAFDFDVPSLVVRTVEAKLKAKNSP